MQTQAIEGKGKWAQPPWTPARRAKHKAGCREAAAAHRRLEFIMEHADTFDALIRIEEKFGIEPVELLKFIHLLPKDRLPLTEEQNRQWREMAIKKIPAAEIYQQMFEVTA